MVNQTQSWKSLKEYIAKIQDNTLRNTMMAEFRKKAVHDWGFNPDSKYGVAKTESIQLDDWEQELVRDINKASQYQVDTRITKRRETAKEAHARMLMFIERGGQLSDIPIGICTDTIKQLYRDCLLEYGNNLLAEADILIGSK